MLLDSLLPSSPERVTLAGAPKLVDHILLAEFDVDTGSTVKYKYPGHVPGYSDDFFANFMLPEGAHNRKCGVYMYTTPFCCPYIVGW